MYNYAVSTFSFCAFVIVNTKIKKITAFARITSQYTGCKYGGPLGRHCTKAQLIRPRCVVLTMLHKSLASSSICSVYFIVLTSFCVPECYQKGVKSSKGEKGFFFLSFSAGSPLRGKQTKERSSRLPRDSLHFRLEDLRKCVTDHI